MGRITNEKVQLITPFSVLQWLTDQDCSLHFLFHFHCSQSVFVLMLAPSDLRFIQTRPTDTSLHPSTRVPPQHNHPPIGPCLPCTPSESLVTTRSRFSRVATDSDSDHSPVPESLHFPCSSYAGNPCSLHLAKPSLLSHDTTNTLFHLALGVAARERVRGVSEHTVRPALCSTIADDAVTRSCKRATIFFLCNSLLSPIVFRFES